MNNVKNFVIDRAKWDCGNPQGGMLLNPETEKMCCLGFYSLALGLEKSQIESVCQPSGVCHTGLSDVYPEWIGEVIDEGDGVMYLEESDCCNDLIFVNDATGVDSPDREKEIKELFASQGIEVEFEGTYE